MLSLPMKRLLKPIKSVLLLIMHKSCDTPILHIPSVVQAADNLLVQMP